MRFSCEHCGKKYVVKDELVPKRTYNMKCKACGSTIVVKGSGGGDEAPGSLPTSSTPPTPGTTPAGSAAKHPSSAASPRGSQPYIDLFEDLGLESDGTAPAWPDEPARRNGAPASSPPAARPTPPAAPPAVDDPFARAYSTRASAPPSVPSFPPPPAQSPAPPAQSSAQPLSSTPARSFAPPSEPATTPRSSPRPPPSPARRRITPPVIAAAAAVVVVVLTVGAVLRPWRSPSTSAPPSETTTAPARPPSKPAAPPVTAAPAPAAAEPPPPAATKPAERPAETVAVKPQPPAPSPTEKESKAEKEAKAEKKKPEGLSTAATRKVLTSAHRSFDSCLDNPSRGLDRPIPAHRITVRLSVEPSGGVKSAIIDDSAVAGAPVGQCLRAAALALSFPAFRGPPAAVDVPVDIPASPAPAVAKAEPPPPAKAEPPPPAVAKAEPPPPAPAPEPAGGASLAVEIGGVGRTRSGASIDQTLYAQNADDAEITDRQFADGVVTYFGQVGKGHGSAFAGIGMNVHLEASRQPIDGSKFRYLTIRLASPTTRKLRVRLLGPEQAVANAGCYPIVMLPVSENLKAYKIKLEEFAPEGYCGTKGRSAEETLSKLIGFEVADVAIQGKPTNLSVGTITLSP